LDLGGFKIGNQKEFFGKLFNYFLAASGRVDGATPHWGCLTRLADLGCKLKADR
jgi:hypothetical protein